MPVTLFLGKTDIAAINMGVSPGISLCNDRTFKHQNSSYYQRYTQPASLIMIAKQTHPVQAIAPPSVLSEPTLHPCHEEIDRDVITYLVNTWDWASERQKKGFVSWKLSDVVLFMFPTGNSKRVKLACELLLLGFLMDGEFSPKVSPVRWARDLRYAIIRLVRSSILRGEHGCSRTTSVPALESRHIQTDNHHRAHACHHIHQNPCHSEYRRCRGSGFEGIYANAGVSLRYRARQCDCLSRISRVP